MLDVLLIRADRLQTGGHPRHRHPPLDLWYAEAGLMEAGMAVALLDLWVPADRARLVDYRRDPPALVVIKGESWCLEESRELAASFRARGAITLAVGQQAYHYPAHRCGDQGWDLVVPGECEQALVALVPDLLQHGLDSAPARACRRRLWQRQPYQTQPERLPRPRRQTERLADYPFPLPVRGRVVRRWGYVQSAWGCPYACTHCTDVVRKSSGARLRRRPVAQVVDQIAELLAAGAEGIVFEDDTLFCSPAHLLALCAEIQRRGLCFAWVANARPDELDARRVAAAAAAGAVLLKLGIETGSNRLAQRLGKAVAGQCWRQHCERGLGLLAEAGVGALGLLMTGIPGEDAALAARTRHWVAGLPLDYVQVQVFTAYPEVRLGQGEPGLGNQYHYPVAGGIPLAPLADGIAPAAAADLQRRLYRRFYARPGFVLRHLRRCWRWYLCGANLRALAGWTGYVLRRQRVPGTATGLGGT